VTGLVCSGITGSFHSGLGGGSGRTDGFNGSGGLGLDKVARRGSDEDEKNWGRS